MRRFFLLTVLLGLIAPQVSFAAPNEALLSLYRTRGDLQTAFDAKTYAAIPDSSAGFLIDLEDWALQYGWQEYPSLSAYAPKVSPPTRTGSSAEPLVTASSYLVLDRASGQILAAKNAGASWPIASLTKLMTTQIALDHGIASTAVKDVIAADDVGGAKLYVNSGATFTFDDLVAATLVGSANNAANAIARATGLSRSSFLDEMNLRASALGLHRTTYVDPTGIELGNVSTARELARVADVAFSRQDIRRYTTTAVAQVDVLSDGTTKSIKNTDWMLWKPEYDDIYVMGGKTGYLDESGWNFVVALRPQLKDEKREILVVIFGAGSRADSFKDARALSEWAWSGFKWKE